MYLYYAMGGGLGHITRAFAIMEKCSLNSSFRILTSSSSAPAVAKHSPCNIDHLSPDIQKSRKKYYQFLREYIAKYKIQAIVLDTFYAGLIGEWNEVALETPTFLIGRYLNFGEYQKKIRDINGKFPVEALFIEKQNKDYFNFLAQHTKISTLYKPIILNKMINSKNHSAIKIAVVHSGNSSENEKLDEIAQNIIKKEKTSESIEYFRPGHNTYPFSKYLNSFTHIISGAGYNSVALANLALDYQKFIFHPFERKFDDQKLRLKRYLDNNNKKMDNGAEEAALWIEKCLQKL